MAHFAELDEHNTVIRVLVVNDSDTADSNGQEDEQVGKAFLQQVFGADTTWVQTSYHGHIRKNFAGIGFVYDTARDAFIPPQPDPAWVLDEVTCQWQAPSTPTTTATTEPSDVLPVSH